MNKMNRQRLYSYAFAFMLIFIAAVCRIAARNIDDEFADKFLNFARTFIYAGLFFAWGISVNRRVIQKYSRRIFTAVAALMVFWIILREIKYRFAADPVIIRYLWYGYYIPMLLIPVMAVLISITLSKAEDYRLPKRVSVLFVPTVILIMLVLTNDFHQLAFIFPQGAAKWSEQSYSYGIVYFLSALWAVGCSLAAFLIMLIKYRVPNNRRRSLMPAIPFAVSVIYVVLYAVNAPFVRGITGDLAAFLCTLFAVFFESAIMCGLVRSNMGYFELFGALRDIPLQITDNDYKTELCTSDWEAIDKQDMILALKKPVISDSGKRLHNMPINGGHVVWTEDVSELLSLGDMLRERHEEQEERNVFLKYEYEKEKAHKVIQEQNLLYDLLQKRTQAQIDKIDSLVKDYQAAKSAEEKHKILSNIIVLGSFIKRSKDFALSGNCSQGTDQSRLENAFGESFRALRLLGIRGGFVVDMESERGLSDSSYMAYEFFEDVIEAVLNEALFLNVSVADINSTLRITIRTDCKIKSGELSLKYPQMIAVNDEDGETLMLPLTTGGGK